MSTKITAEIEHKLTVDNAAAIKKVEDQAAAYKKLADAQKQAEARERTGTTGMDADTVRLLRMARADKAAGRYTDSFSQGYGTEDLMRRHRAERDRGLPAAQVREIERTKEMLAGSGAKAGGSFGLASLLKGGAIGATVGVAADVGTSLLKDYYDGQKSFGQSLKDATRETLEGLPIVGGFIQSVRKFGDQLLHGREMAETAQSIKMYDRGTQLTRNRYETEDRLRPYQLDSSAASARARAAGEASYLLAIERSRMGPPDPRMTASQQGITESDIRLASLGQNRTDLRGVLGREDVTAQRLRTEEQKLLQERQALEAAKKGANTFVDFSLREADLAKRTEANAEKMKLSEERRKSVIEQIAGVEKNMGDERLAKEQRILDKKKLGLDIAKEEFQKHKDQAVSFDQMDPEQQFALSQTFGQAKASGYGSLTAEQKRQVLGSGLAGKDLIQQAQDAATRNPLFQGINEAQGGKTLGQLQDAERKAKAILDAAAPNGVEARLLEMIAELAESQARIWDKAIPGIKNAMDNATRAGTSALESKLKAQQLMSDR